LLSIFGVLGNLRSKVDNIERWTGLD